MRVTVGSRRGNWRQLRGIVRAASGLVAFGMIGTAIYLNGGLGTVHKPISLYLFLLGCMVVGFVDIALLAVEPFRRFALLPGTNFDVLRLPIILSLIVRVIILTLILIMFPRQW